MQAASNLAPPQVRPRRKPPLHFRARSVPHRRQFIIALVWTAVLYLALIGTTAALFAFMVQPNQSAAILLVGFGALSAALWLVSFLKRRGCHCPLCKGTPLADNSAHTHEKAVRFFPLNYGTSNVIRSIVRQHFRCQFCGTPFDLLKPLTKNRWDEDFGAPQPRQMAVLPPNRASQPAPAPVGIPIGAPGRG